MIRTNPSNHLLVSSAHQKVNIDKNSKGKARVVP